MTLKKFLNNLTEDGRYYAEMAESIAEIYYLTDAKPCVLVELREGLLYLNFRSDLQPNVVAQISHDIFKITEDIVIDKTFALSKDKGIIYGDEAMGIHYLNIFFALQSSITKDSEEAKDAIYIVKDPIPTFNGKRAQRSDKLYRKLWGDT